MTILFSPDEEKFYHASRKVFCHQSRTWLDVAHLPKNMTEISVAAAVKQLQSSKQRIRIPIGVIGSREPTPAQYKIAEQVGNELAHLGFTVLCGGMKGVMEAVCRGVQHAGGVSIGLLPDSDPKQANNFVTIPLATGIGVARNALISQAALCLVAIGGGYGTLSEIAYGLQFGKAVFGMGEEPPMAGMTMLQSVDELIANICKIVMNLAHLNA